MANTIRIIMGIIMLVIAYMGILIVLYFTRGNLLGYFKNLDSTKDLLVIAILPAASAWLLLRPKNSTYAWVGLGIALLYSAYIFVTQIL